MLIDHMTEEAKNALHLLVSGHTVLCQRADRYPTCDFRQLVALGLALEGVWNGEDLFYVANLRGRDMYLEMSGTTNMERAFEINAKRDVNERVDAPALGLAA